MFGSDHIKQRPLPYEMIRKLDFSSLSPPEPIIYIPQKTITVSNIYISFTIHSIDPKLVKAKIVCFTPHYQLEI